MRDRVPVRLALEAGRGVPWFVHPSLALLGAGLVGVPILIHILMRRRRKPVAWGAMRFVIQAYQQQRRRLRFEQWLLLAARCLLVLLIALALARPMLGAAAPLIARASRTAYILIDNGLASEARINGATALEEMKAQARAVLSTLDASRGDRAALVALGAPADAVVAAPTQDLAAVRAVIDALPATAGPTDLTGGLDAVRSGLTRDGTRPDASGLNIVVLSPWRVGSLDARRAGAASAAASSSALLPVLASTPSEAALENVAITSAAPLRSVIIGARESRTATEAVRVTLTRSGTGVGRELSVRVRLSFVGRSGAGPAQTVTARFEAGRATCEATASVDVPALADDAFGVTLLATLEADAGANAIAGDDVYRQPVPARQRLRVALIAPASSSPRTAADFEAADWLALSLSPGGGDAPNADLRVSRLDPRSLSAADVLAQDAILVPRPDLLDDNAWKMCRRAVDGGALLLVTPPAAAGAQLWTDAMTAGLGVPWKFSRDPRALTPAAQIGSGQPGSASASGVLALLAGELIELAKPVQVSRVLDVQVEDSEVPLRLSDGTPLLVLARGVRADGGVSSGMVALLATAPDLSWTTLPAMPLMVPLMQELVRQGVGQAAGRTTTTAGAALVAGPGIAELIRVDEAAGGAPSESPRETIAPGGVPRFAGLYRGADAAGITRSLIAVNPDPAGGRVEAQSRAEVQAALAAMGANVAWFAPESGDSAPDLAKAIGNASENAGASWHVPALIAALLLVLGELALARLASHARILKPANIGSGLTASQTRPHGAGEERVA